MGVPSSIEPDTEGLLVEHACALGALRHGLAGLGFTQTYTYRALEAELALAWAEVAVPPDWTGLVTEAPISPRPMDAGHAARAVRLTAPSG